MRRALCLPLILFFATSAAAQTVEETPVQLSIGGGGVSSLLGSGGDSRVMLSFPRTGASEGGAIEVFVGSYSGTGAIGTKAVYGVQMRGRTHPGRPRAIDPFWTYGLTGAVVQYETSSCVNRQCTPERQTRLMPPVMFVVGGGYDCHVGARVSIRLDIQAGFFLVVPVGARAGASLSVPLGHQR